MKIEAHPLVVAAALGLLGPAALAEDEDERGGPAGLWSRVSQARSGSNDLHQLAPLGAELEVIPFEGRLILDDGSDLSAGLDSWTMDDAGLARQELALAGAKVVRQLKQEGDALEVRTVVDLDGRRAELLDCYTRKPNA